LGGGKDESSFNGHQPIKMLIMPVLKVFIMILINGGAYTYTKQIAFQLDVLRLKKQILKFNI